MAIQYGAPRDQDGKDRKNNRYGEDRKDAAPKAAPADESPPSLLVQKFHKNAAVDARPEDIHHTLGYGSTQASPGDHSHDGGDSTLLLEGFTLVGSKASPATMWPSILACLTRLGAKDSTT